MIHVMADKLTHLVPEMIMLGGAVACLMTGMANRVAVRRLTAPLAGLALAAAGVATWWDWWHVDPGDIIDLPPLMTALYVKAAVVIVGLLLLCLAVAVPERLRATRESDTEDDSYDPGRTLRGEFFAFFLFSLTGVMLAGGANDLVWLFLALELTSLPTYVMVSLSRDRILAQESGVKYFFLGAMAAAVFLYGFALIYGVTGTTTLIGPTIPGTGVTSVADTIAAYNLAGQAMPPLLVAGFVLSIVGIGFKIAAFPMHFYAADVYEGAATPVTAFLAFVPKAAGFVALIILLGTLGEVDPNLGDRGVVAIQYVIWGIAAATMTLGNVLALLQNSVKRMLAYSSIAHSGYMLVALTGFGSTGGDAAAAVLFYLLAYALGNLGAFAVIAILQARGDEAQTYDDLAGLARRNPLLAGILLISTLSLVGLPPTVGFVGKLYLFSAAIEAGHVTLVVIAVLNSAVSAVYYLRLASVAFFAEPAEGVTAPPAFAMRTSATIAAVAVIILGVAAGPAVRLAASAAGAARTPSGIVENVDGSLRDPLPRPADRVADRLTD